MLDYRTLADKPEISLPGAEERLVDIFSLTYAGGSGTDTYIEVTEPYIARPDLIALAVYKDDSYADLICRYNGISNPFELNEGMVIAVPDIIDVPDFYIERPAASMLSSDSDSIVLSRPHRQKLLNEKRSPNQLVEGESNVIIDKANGWAFY